jgi:hypothetical protein
MPLAVLTGMAFACAITSPAPAATVTQGTPVTITGTLNGAAAAVIVKLGSTTLGSASIVGLTWSYSWTPLVGDVGSRTINAVATGPSGASATAQGVDVTVASSGFAGDFGAITPGVALYLRGDLGRGLTSTTVNTWANQAGAATGVTEKTAGVGIGSVGAGVGGRAAVVLNGSSQAGTYTLAMPAPGTTPTFYYLISKQSRTSLAGAPQRILAGATGNDFLLYQDAGSDTLRMYGTAGFQDVSPSITHVWARTALLFDGTAASRIKWGSYATVTGAACQTASAASARVLGFDASSGSYNQGEFGLILTANGVTAANYAATLAALDAAADSWFGASNVLM